jgi:hypothetical protein
MGRRRDHIQSLVLERHRSRRLQGVPMLSVLVGEAKPLNGAEATPRVELALNVTQRELAAWRQRADARERHLVGEGLIEIEEAAAGKGARPSTFALWSRASRRCACATRICSTAATRPCLPSSCLASELIGSRVARGQACPGLDGRIFQARRRGGGRAEGRSVADADRSDDRGRHPQAAQQKH